MVRNTLSYTAGDKSNEDISVDHNEIYHGEFLHGKSHGQGKSYHENNKLKYDGNWKYGKYHGQGKSYHENGKLEYNGNWKYGKYHGQGKSYHENGQLEYNGEWKDDKFQNGKQILNGKQIIWSDGKEVPIEIVTSLKWEHNKKGRFYIDIKEDNVNNTDKGGKLLINIEKSDSKKNIQTHHLSTVFETDREHINTTGKKQIKNIDQENVHSNNKYHSQQVIEKISEDCFISTTKR